MEINFLFFVLFGLSFAQLPLVQCDIPPKSYSSFRPTAFCNPADYMRYPSTVNDIVAIVNEAISRNVTVKAFGARHSQTDIICTEGIPVDMNKFKSFRMNDDNVTATFGAGVTIREAGKFLLQYGRSLRTTPAFGNITLAGAIGTCAHGSTIKHNSSLSAQLIRMTIVNGLGETLVISDSEDLRSFRTHLGLLGIIVDVTLYTVPLYKVRAHNYIVSDTILTDGRAQNWVRTSDHIVFYWFPSLKEVIVANLTFIPADTPGTAFSSILPASTGFFNLIIKKTKETVYSITSSECAAASALDAEEILCSSSVASLCGTFGITENTNTLNNKKEKTNRALALTLPTHDSRNKLLHVFELVSQAHLLYQLPGIVPIYSEDGITLNNPAVGYPYDMLAPQCNEENAGIFGNACLWAHGDINANLSGLDNEISIPLTSLSDLVSTVNDIQRKTPLAFPLDGLIMRFSGKSDSFLSPNFQRDTINVEFAIMKRTDEYNDASGGLAGYQTLLQAMTKRMSGRSHWGKSGMVYHSSAMLNLKLEPQVRQNFIAAMQKFDPKGIFQNNFGRRLQGITTKSDIDPQIVHCALLDNCFCSEDSDCADSQNCVSLPGYDSFPVCKTRNELPEHQFDKTRFSNVNPLWYLSANVPALVAAVLGKCSLGNFVKTVADVLGSLG